MVECLPVGCWTLGKILVRLCSKTERVKGFMVSEKTYFPRLCNITSIHNKYHRDKQRLHVLPPLLPRQLDRWAMIRPPVAGAECEAPGSSHSPEAHSWKGHRAETV